MAGDIDPEVFYSDEYQAALEARYHAAHAVIMASDYASLQEDIDSGRVWQLGGGAEAYAMQAVLIGAVMAPPETLVSHHLFDFFPRPHRVAAEYVGR